MGKQQAQKNTSGLLNLMLLIQGLTTYFGLQLAALFSVGCCNVSELELVQG